MSSTFIETNLQCLEALKDVICTAAAGRRRSSAVLKIPYMYRMQRAKQQDTNIRVQTSDGDNINYISACFIYEYLNFYNSVLVL